MTPGGVRRKFGDELHELREQVRLLEDRITVGGNGDGGASGSVLTDRQMAKIDERIKEQIKLRLVLWATASFSLGSAITFILGYLFGHK